jgi:hypothetical protein
MPIPTTQEDWPARTSGRSEDDPTSTMWEQQEPGPAQTPGLNFVDSLGTVLVTQIESPKIREFAGPLEEWAKGKSGE